MLGGPSKVHIIKSQHIVMFMSGIEDVANLEQ